MKPRKQQPRGVALLIVVVSIAILATLAADFAYNSRVDLQLATNQRDELRAYYLAKSGIGMSRLLLKFQKQLDGLQIPNPAGLLSQFLPGPGLSGATAGATGATAPTPTTLNIQLWRMAHVDCHMLAPLMANAFDPRPPEGTLPSPEACFQTTISDEEEKINLTRLNAPQLTSQPTVLALMSLFADKRFEFLFQKEDSNHVKVTPQEVILNIKDWIDDDALQSSLNLSGQGDVFLNGFADENGPYEHYNPRYKAKNARFDSLDELYMVHGVNDRFMAAFKDRLTTYPDVNRNPNINTDDPLLLYAAVLAVADPAHPDPRLQNPLFVDQLLKQIRNARMFSFFGMGVSDFVNIVAASGIPVNQVILGNVQNNRWVSDKTQTYRLSSVGQAGAVQKTLTAVIRADDRLGTLLYWKEE